MVKTPDQPLFQSIPKSKQQQLLTLMDKSKLSLIKAAQVTGIPYVQAKQILFMYGSSRAVVRGLSSSTKISPRRNDAKNGFKTKHADTQVSKFSLTTKENRTQPKAKEEPTVKEITSEIVIKQTQKIHTRKSPEKAQE